MSTLSPPARRFLRAAACYLILGLILQALALFDAWLGFNPFAITTGGVTNQALLVGWLSQLGLALAYDRWLPDSGRSGLVFWLLNAGLVLSILGQPGLNVVLSLLAARQPQLRAAAGALLGISAGLGGVLQLAAGGIFAWEVWRRPRR